MGWTDFSLLDFHVLMSTLSIHSVIRFLLPLRSNGHSAQTPSRLSVTGQGGVRAVLSSASQLIRKTTAKVPCPLRQEVSPK